jgi:hypothetical protein
MIFNTDYLIQNGYFTPDQGYYYNMLMNQGLFGDGGTSGGYNPQGGSAGPKIGALAAAPIKRLGPTGAPPTPPPGGGAPTANLGPAGGFAGMAGMPGYNQEAFDYIRGLDNDYSRDMLIGLFGDETYANGVIYNVMQNIDSQKRSVQDIQNFIAGIDTGTPEGRHQVMVANQQLGNLQGNIRDLMDAVMNLKKRMDERKQYVKGIIDLAERANEAIIRNVGKS